MANLQRCVVEEVVVRLTGTGLARRIGAGQVVDFDESVGKITLASAVAGREACFEPVDPAPKAGRRAKASTQDEPADASESAGKVKE